MSRAHSKPLVLWLIIKNYQPHISLRALHSLQFHLEKASPLNARLPSLNRPKSYYSRPHYSASTRPLRTDQRLGNCFTSPAAEPENTLPPVLQSAITPGFRAPETSVTMPQPNSCTAASSSLPRPRSTWARPPAGRRLSQEAPQISSLLLLSLRRRPWACQDWSHTRRSHDPDLPVRNRACPEGSWRRRQTAPLPAPEESSPARQPPTQPGGIPVPPGPPLSLEVVQGVDAAGGLPVPAAHPAAGAAEHGGGGP